MSAQQASSALQKPTPWRSSAGSTRNIGSVGSTYQKVDSACAAILTASPVSRQSQRMPSRETSGSETMRAPSVGERRATSETTAMMTPDRPTLSAR